VGGGEGRCLLCSCGCVALTPGGEEGLRVLHHPKPCTLLQYLEGPGSRVSKHPSAPACERRDACPPSPALNRSSLRLKGAARPHPPTPTATPRQRAQDRVPPFPTTISRSVLEASLGKSVDAMFESISEKPVAAASLGQVRRPLLLLPCCARSPAGAPGARGHSGLACPTPCTCPAGPACSARLRVGNCVLQVRNGCGIRSGVHACPHTGVLRRAAARVWGRRGGGQGAAAGRAGGGGARPAAHTPVGGRAQAPGTEEEGAGARGARSGWQCTQFEVVLAN